MSHYYYNDGFGTVWSSIFDLTDNSVEICFGAPTHNPWRLVNFNEELAGYKNFEVVFPVVNEPCHYE